MSKKKPAYGKQIQKKVPTPTKDNIFICWCDNGLVDGKFAEGLVYTIIGGGLPIASAMRVQGNQIGRQRQVALEYWMNKTDFEWILWIDSDIHITAEVIHKLWANVDKNERPVVSGTYFISKENEQSLMAPYPAAFNWVDGDPYKISYLHPLPAGDNLIKVDSAGFGLLLMHRNVVEKMLQVHGNIPFFNETGVGEQFVSEDINFFRLMGKAGIPLYVHTGALVKHIKRFSLDVEYYKKFWSGNAG